ncbi:MAG: hypothetical protein K6U12_11265 [Armatimonadetes bacterium]|nr:hypothetical protein [Armatimonadota bacterium]CUU38011.1 hypothetical protein DCOP10_12388 [Armatimonadetes bacterium DC]
MWWGVSAVLLIHLWALPRVFNAPPLRLDSDTAAMLDAIQASGGLAGVGRWFRGDWLLENGFYRPISSASLTLDYALYGEAAWGFCFTNWLLLLTIALGVAVLTPRLLNVAPAWGWGVAVVLSAQYTGLTRLLTPYSTWGWVLIVLVGISLWAWRSGVRLDPDLWEQFDTRWLWIALAVGALFWGFDRLLDADYVRLIEWVPSRTALLGAAFGVWAAVCFLRAGEEGSWRWLGLGGLLYLLALGSYEQPIMLAPFITATAIARRTLWKENAFTVAGTALACALLIVMLRLSFVTTEPTRYQQQQLRSSLSGPMLTYFSDLFPPVSQWGYWRTVGLEPTVWLLKDPWDRLVGLLLYAGVLVAFYRWRGRFGYALGWHALTLLPMAFLHPFEHYWVLPQVGKTLTDCLLIGWGIHAFVACLQAEWGKILHDGTRADPAGV